MTSHRPHVPKRLEKLADAVLLPCFDGVAPPEWIRRRVGEALGGVCLFARNVKSVEQLAALSASLEAERESVVIAIDEEAGDVTRIDAATGSRFPGAFALGRLDDDSVTEAIAREVGLLLREAGISLNLAPCADVAINPDNPVIGSRSFGESPALVARQIAAWVRGQQSAGVATCTKHYPGHGDTNVDSHRSVAVLTGDLDALRAQALIPFAAAIAAGTAAIMPGHLLVPAVDGVPATVSTRWLTEILRGEYGFDGTIVTDALEMAGVAAAYGIPGAAVRSLIAGADLLCIGGETRPAAEIDSIRDAIVDAVLAGDLPEQRLVEAAERGAAVGIAAVRAADGVGGDTGLADVEPWLSPIDVALKAVQQAGDIPALRGDILVLRCSDTPNIAVGVVPWGPATVLDSACTEIVLRDGDVIPEAAIGLADTVLIVTRDRHRFGWMGDIVAATRWLRPEAILVEMGISGVSASDAPALATFGATAASSHAIVRLLHGAAVTA